jgi:succinoglycan biosynthesis protein ExoA
VGLASWAAGAPGLPWLTLGFVIPVVYAAGVSAVTALFARDVPPSVRVRVPVVLAAMHMCWGAGFLCSPRRLAKRP